MKNNMLPVAAVVCIAAVVITMLYGLMNANNQETKRMDVCVSNGGEWIRNAPEERGDTSSYDCRRPE